jgi:hypothetical protein
VSTWRADDTYGLSRWIRVPGALLIGVVVGGATIALVYYTFRGVTGKTLPTSLLWFLIGSAYAQTIASVLKEARTP